MRKLKTLELHRISEEEFKVKSKFPIILILDNIRSMHNVGAAFRTADAFMIEKIILVGITPCPPHREIHKTALGAENTVEWFHVDEAETTINELKKSGYTIASVEQAEDSTSLESFEMKKNDKICLIVGNEVEGVDQKIIDKSDLCLEIPQFGTKHSLNVSVSLGVTLWEILKQSQLD